MTSTESPRDFHIDEFVEILRALEQMPPVVTEYEESLQLALPAGSRQGRWYHNQRAHMVGWFTAQLALDEADARRKKPNCSARTAYNRLQTATGVLWIAEALGVEEAAIFAAVEAIQVVPVRSRAAAARKQLPWERIAELADQYLDSKEESR